MLQRVTTTLGGIGLQLHCLTQEVCHTVVIGSNSYAASGSCNTIIGNESYVHGSGNILVGHHTVVTGNNNTVVANGKTVEASGKIVLGDLSIDKSVIRRIYFRKKFKRRLPPPIIDILAGLCSDVDLTFDLVDVIEELIKERIVHLSIAYTK